MTTPNKAVIKQWVDALRSGEYKQGEGCLKTDDRFCCLGVLCDLYTKDNPEAKWAGDTFTSGSEAEDYVLTDDIVKWAGLPDESPSIRYTTLTHLNDAGKPFPEIADLIEAEYLTSDVDA